MNDRELLELAAKAQGIKGAFSDYHKGICYSKLGSLDMHVWNPLTDDGDALRLAVKLGITLELRGCNSTHPYSVVYWAGFGLDEQPDDGDPYAATRRAIVRAAAEIGKTI